MAFVHDIVMAAGSFALSLYLRLGDELYIYSPTLLVQGTVLFTVVAAAVSWFMGLYRGVWRYASLNDLVAIARSTTLAVLLFLLVMFLWTRLEALPRSLLVINWFVLMAMLGGPRFLYRLIKDRRFEWRLEEEGRRRIPVLLVGSEDGAELFIRALARQHGANYSIAGIVSERHNRVGQRIHGVEVLGTLDAIPGVVASLNERGARPQRLILTKDDIEGAKVAALLDTAEVLGMTLARLPRLTDFKSGIADELEVKPVAIEDLLGRPQTALDRKEMAALIHGRRVCVTGAGGSIGSELCRQIAGHGPAHMTLID
ncbi:MAG: polysaccharide biosynthesis protein, partial [Rhodospirillales bacterium]|nr:polysaccharide biosynthesis protein [Rhodospirillales bacterium]